MATQGIAPGLACHLSAWGDRDCDSGRRDLRVVARAQIVSCESLFVVQWKLDLHVVVRPGPMDHGSGSWSGNDTTK